MMFEVGGNLETALPSHGGILFLGYSFRAVVISACFVVEAFSLQATSYQPFELYSLEIADDDVAGIAVSDRLEILNVEF